MRTTISFLTISFLLITDIINSHAQVDTTLPLEVQTESYTLASADPFMLQGLQFTPDDSVYIHYDHETELFSVYGMASVHIGNFPMSISLGTLFEPGIILDTDTMTSGFSMSVVDTFSIHKLVFVGEEGSTFINYDFDALQYEITGDAVMILNHQPYDIGLGHEDSPGLIYKNGAVTRVIVNVNSGMEMHGLAAVEPSIVLKWKTGNGNTYHGHGQFSVLIQDGYFHADAGTNANPGITIVDGAVYNVSINVIGGALLFGALPTYDAFRLQYHQERQVYVLTGDIVIGLPLGTLFNLPQLSIHAGDANTGGIEYHTATHNLHVESAIFEVRNIGGKDTLSVLGGFQLKDLSVTIEDNVPIDITGFIILPMGIALGADLQFTYDPDNESLPFFIHSIGVEWEATSVASAIPMGETGFFLVRMAGSLSGLDKPSQLAFSDTIGFTFGEIISVKLPVLGEQEVAPFYFEAFGTWSFHELTMGVSGDIGAKFIGTHWEGLLGEAEVDLDFQFGKRFSMIGTLSLPSDPLLIATAEATFSKGDVDLLAKAQLIVPHFIPIIGGKTFGNVNAAVRMKKNDAHNSFGAGWMKINLIFDHTHLGALYNVGTGNIHKIGAGEAEAIVTTIENDPVDPPPGDPPPNYWLCTLHHDFTVESNKPAAYLQSHLKILNTSKFIDPNPNDNDPNITITARIESLDPDYPNLEAYRPGDSLNIFPSSNGLAIDNDGIVSIHVNLVDSAAWIAANHGAEIYGVINWPEQPEVLLTPGMHTMILEGWCPLNVFFDEEDISFTTSPAFPRPTTSLTMYPGWSTDILYSSYITDSTEISLFFSHDTSRNGQLIGRYPFLFGDPVPTMPGYRVMTFLGLNNLVPPIADDSVYFYTAIIDHVNPVVYSEPRFYSPVGTREISGQVLLADGTPVEGVPMIMFRESFPQERMTTYTDAEGRYAYYNCHINTPVVIQAYAPAGHYFSQAVDVSMDFVSREIKTPDWIELVVQLHDGDNVTADFELIDQPVSLYGAVYDTNSVSIPGVNIILVNSSGSIAYQLITTEFGFVAFNVIPDDYVLTAILPTDSNGYHWPVQFISVTGAGIKNRTDSLSFSGTPVRLDYHAHNSNGPFFWFVDVDTGKSLAGGQLECNLSGSQDEPLISLISAKNGIVNFDEQDLLLLELYDLMITPPPGYHCQDPCPQSFTWLGTLNQFVVLNMEKN